MTQGGLYRLTFAELPPVYTAQHWAAETPPQGILVSRAGLNETLDVLRLPRQLGNATAAAAAVLAA